MNADGRWEPEGFDVFSALRIRFDGATPTWSGELTEEQAIYWTRWRANRMRCLVEFCDRWVAAMEGQRGA